MNRLILMRHARAESSAPTGGDRARPLSDAGRLDAADMAAALGARGVRPDMAVVSDALRTRQTWEEMRDRFGDVELDLSPELYNAGPDRLRQAVDQVEDRCGVLILIAHNPGVHQFAVELLVEAAAPPSALDRMMGGFPPGAAAVFAVDTAGRRTFEGFFTPGDGGRSA